MHTSILSLQFFWLCQLSTKVSLKSSKTDRIGLHIIKREIVPWGKKFVTLSAIAFSFRHVKIFK